MFQREVRHRGGFSLIELAIVLAIIGLIVGGIMMGGDLLRASQLQKIQSDIQQYDAAVQQFREKYNSYPGDMPDATTYWSSAINAAGNNMLDASNEYVQAWYQLSQAGMISGSYNGVYTAILVGGVNAPTTAIDGAVFGMRYLQTCALSGQQAFGNSLEVGVSAGAGYADGNFLTSTETQTMDAKMDDGYACQGRFRGKGSVGCPAYNATTGDYTLTTTAVGCGINYILDRF